MATVQTAARRYTLAEVEALREAIRKRHAFPVIEKHRIGMSCEVKTVTKPPDDAFVEDHVRTAMMAGIDASEYGDEDHMQE